MCFLLCLLKYLALTILTSIVHIRDVFSHYLNLEMSLPQNRTLKHTCAS